VITEPQGGQPVLGSTVNVRGVAYTGGAAQVASVELSTDGGVSWQPAELLAAPSDAGGELRWAWRQFEGEIALPVDGAVEILARASDTCGHSQPADASGIWNFKGYMNNAWCRV